MFFHSSCSSRVKRRKVESGSGENERAVRPKPPAVRLNYISALARTAVCVLSSGEKLVSISRISAHPVSVLL